MLRRCVDSAEGFALDEEHAHWRRVRAATCTSGDALSARGLREETWLAPREPRGRVCSAGVDARGRNTGGHAGKSHSSSTRWTFTTSTAGRTSTPRQPSASIHIAVNLSPAPRVGRSSSGTRTRLPQRFALRGECELVMPMAAAFRRSSSGASTGWDDPTCASPGSRCRPHVPISAATERHPRPTQGSPTALSCLSVAR